MSTPLVTIAIPTFNRHDGLHTVLNSLSNSTYKNLEIIIGDNSNPSIQVLNHHLIGYYRTTCGMTIAHHMYHTNIGMEANFNFLAKMGTGKYFAFHADDDTWSDNYISNAVALMEKESRVVSVAGETYRKFPTYMQYTTKERIEAYIRGEQHPFHFYTLKPRWIIEKYTPFIHSISLDSLHQMDCLREGWMVTDYNTKQNYSRHGVSETTEGQIAVLGYPKYYKYLIALNLLYHVYREHGTRIALLLITRKWWLKELLMMGLKRFIVNKLFKRNAI